jgi:hypothetical protein
MKQEDLEAFLLQIEVSDFTPRAKEIITILAPYMHESPSIKNKIQQILDIEKELLDFELSTFKDIDKILNEKMSPGAKV